MFYNNPAVLDHRMHQVCAEAVAELAVIGRIQQDEVGQFAAFERSDFRFPSHDGGGISRHRNQDVYGSHTGIDHHLHELGEAHAR